MDVLTKMRDKPRTSSAGKDSAESAAFLGFNMQHWYYIQYG